MKIAKEYITWSPNDMLEIKLKKEENFLIIAETLKRIGMVIDKSKTGLSVNTLMQSCHILHKKGRYYIMHFREMFALDGQNNKIEVNDIYRRNGIALVLKEWGLCDIVSKIDNHTLQGIVIIPHIEKKNWHLNSNYQVGIMH